MKPAIHDRGRGPEIVGSRITVYDVLDETRGGATVEQLARDWRLTVEQIEFALKYIEENREEVERDWAEIQTRNERQRAESEAKLAAIRANRLPPKSEMWEKLQRAKAAMEARYARHPNRCESPGTIGAGAVGAGEPVLE